MGNDISTILCVADINISGALDQCLKELSLPEVFVQRAKQMSLTFRHGLLGLRSSAKLEESRALLYRIYVPKKYSNGIVNYISEGTDIKMGGGGCILLQHISHYRGEPLTFDVEKLERFCGKAKKLFRDEHSLISCTIPRGSANSLAEAVLELGVCVPIIFYGNGVGLRDKLGLMRITVPVEKEIIWFLVPRSEVHLVEKTLIPLAHLDVPGKGFLYNFPVHAPVVNLRVMQGRRTHAATMEQVIAALDEVRGSSDWRRLGSRKPTFFGGGEKTFNARGLFFIGEEEEAEVFRRTAMENGARGATMNSLEMRTYSSSMEEHSMESHSRSLCDIIVTPAVEERILKNIEKTGLFADGKTCVLKTFGVEMHAFNRK